MSASKSGNVTESIQVTGTPPLLETETSTSGQVLEGQTLVKMPVLQKAFYRIYLYMPGMNVVNGQHAIGPAPARSRLHYRRSQLEGTRPGQS